MRTLAEYKIAASELPQATLPGAQVATFIDRCYKCQRRLAQTEIHAPGLVYIYVWPDSDCQCKEPDPCSTHWEP